MKKILSVLLFVLFLNPVLPVLAQETQSITDEKMMILPPGKIDNLFGQNHSYSVYLRGNGEVVVNAKFVFTNENAADFNTFVLKTDGQTLNNLVAYQIVKEPECVSYTPTSVCIQYRDADYSYLWGAKYLKADVDYDGEKLAVVLPRTIAENNTSAVFLYYRSFDFTRKELAGYNYNFSSFKVNTAIQNIAVGINTDSDIYLKGVTSAVDYAYPSTTDIAIAGNENKSAKLDQIINTIGYGKITKNASNLAANEQFEVKGEFATSYLGLYAQEIVISIGIILFTLFILLVGVKKLTRRGQPESIIFQSFGLAFASSLTLTLITSLVYLFTKSNTYIQYQIGILVIFLLIFLVLLYASLFLAPVIYMGLKHGVGWGLTTLFMTIFLLALMSGIAVFILLGTDVQKPFSIYSRSVDLEKSL